jgi:pSer/pThr/pTyr-binding forkhead associated (FHA) protein
LVRVDRPYAVAGRSPGVAIRLNSADASLHHLYLHLNRRGLFAVDLASRTGTRFNGVEQRSGWLGIGESLEVAGWTVEVVDADIDRDASPTGSPIEDDLPGLIPLTIAPDRMDDVPRSLGSELVFLGRGACCGLRVNDQAAARVHALIVRNTSAAFIVDLVGSGLSQNGRPIQGAASLADRDVLGLGHSRLHVRIARPMVPLRRSSSPALFNRDDNGEPGLHGLLSMPSIGTDHQAAAMVAYLLRFVQQGQGEMLRRQNELQAILQGALRNQSAILHEALDRMSRIDRELAELREELRRSAPPQPSTPPLPALPPTPLRLPQLESPEIPAGRSTDWILDRVHRLEEENRSTWRDLLGRLVPAVARAD